MEDLTFADMQAMQRALQARYAARWTPLGPEHGRETLLWMLLEAGEVGQLLKKQNDKLMDKGEERAALVEEISDVLMYLNDLLLCYDISPAELAEIYRAKHARNMTRWSVEPSEQP